MKVIYVLSHSYVGDDYDKDISKLGSIIHTYAYKLRNFTNRYQVECWWTEKRISSPISEQADGITFRAFPALSYKFPYRYISFSMLRALRLETRRGPVLIFIHGLRGKWTSLIPLFIRNVPIVIQQHGERTGYRGSRLRKRPWLIPLSMLENMAFRKTDHFFLLFQRAREGMKKYVPPERLSVITCGVDFDVFRPMDKTAAREELGLDTEKRYVLFVGRINERKGARYLIEAMPAVLDEYPATELLLAGPARRERTVADLGELVKSKGIEGSVHFLGPVPNKRLPLFYNASDVFVLPSMTEGLGLVLIEAAACNCPIIGTEVGGIVDLMKAVKKGIMVPPGSSAELADAVKEVLERPDQYNSGLREAVRQYSWDSIFERTVNVFEQLRKSYFPDESPREGTQA
ncbi:MAG: glycosyltransferase family 4 protein [Candidatus Brocadiales bacterium]|nr:glycosyltransferase family 4 protein [Candidatus Bathyanammoxibius amoris]